MTGIFDPCEYCGKPAERYRVGRPRKFCNQSCKSFAMKRHGSERVIDIDPETGCHIPRRKPTSRGYNIYRYRGRKTSAHRVVWMEANGDLPDGMHVDHLCFNPLCVNLDHLEAVTVAENQRRRKCTKLSMEMAREIRASDEPVATLAARYGVTEGSISHVRKGKTWREESTREAQ